MIHKYPIKEESTYIIIFHLHWETGENDVILQTIRNAKSSQSTYSSYMPTTCISQTEIELIISKRLIIPSDIFIDKKYLYEDLLNAVAMLILTPHHSPLEKLRTERISVQT